MFTAAGTFACSFDVPSKDLQMRMEFEPENSYDSNAVVLLLNNQKVGYVPRMHNRLINPSTSVIKDWNMRVQRGQITFIINTSPLEEDDEANSDVSDSDQEVEAE